MATNNHLSMESMTAILFLRLMRFDYAKCIENSTSESYQHSGFSTSYALP